MAVLNLETLGLIATLIFLIGLAIFLPFLVVRALRSKEKVPKKRSVPKPAAKVPVAEEQDDEGFQVISSDSKKPQ